jgi:hypothetical protein
MIDCLMGALLVFFAGGARSTAMIVAVQGEVKIERAAGGKESARVMTRLFPGDKLIAAGKGSATLVFFAGRRERLLPSRRAVVGKDRCSPAAAVKSEKSLAELAARSVQGVGGLAGGGAGTSLRDPGLPERCPEVTPMFGSVVADRKPTLTWKAVPGAVSYRVRLLSSSKAPLWTRDCATPRLPFPDKEKSLQKGGTFYWEVTAVLKDGKKSVAHSKFLTLSDDDAEDLQAVASLKQSKDSADRFVLAAVYQKLKMYDEALKVYQALARRFEDEPLLRVALADYYQRGGRTRAAARELAEATRLGYKPPKRDR